MIIKYYFRDGDKMREHFIDHGEETDCDSAEEYLIRANEVINNPKD